MPVQITVHLHGGTFRGRAQDGSRTAWPPSPARLIGALLHGAHALDGADPREPTNHCARARAAISTLTSAPLPRIFTPDAPLELADRLTWYTRRHAPESATISTKSDRIRYLELRTGTAAGSTEAKPLTISLLPDGNLLFYLVDADLPDTEISALDAAAQQVPFFGASSDHATISVCSSYTVSDAEGLTEWVPDATRREVTVRGWTARTVEWFDARHLLAIEEAGASAILHGDWRVPDVGYRQVTAAERRSHSVGNRHIDGGLLVIPLPRPESFHRYRELADALPNSLASRAFPAVDLSRRGAVRGIGIPAASTTDRDAAFAALPDDVLDFEPVGDLRSWAVQTWEGPGPLWLSATPAAAHRDPRIARAQLAHALSRQGLTLTALVRSPSLRFQTRALPAASQFGLWFVTAEPTDLDPVTAASTVVGPIVIGDETRVGCGVMLAHPRRQT